MPVACPARPQLARGSTFLTLPWRSLYVQTTVVNQFLGRFSTDTMATKTITFSSLTTPQIFQVPWRPAAELSGAVATPRGC